MSDAIAITSSNSNSNSDNSNSLPPSIVPANANSNSNAGISDPLNTTTTIAPLADSEVANGSVALPESGYVPLTSTGRLICTLEEWNRRPQMTIDPVTHEMRFRQLRMQCTHCPEAFTKTHDLYAHIRTHQRHTECPHCSKTLTCMATFVYHVRTHTGEKPYYCPVDGCDFTNSVKYNLKVHLACIRHGGKANLAKFAKVLDLDVCDKSIKKRKDNSVHELGSRRSKKRRKLNNGSSRRADRHRDHGLNAMNPMAGLGGMQSAAYGGYYNQEEYDQMSAQLLFQLGQYPQNGMGAMNPMANMYDPTNPVMQMDWSANLGMMEQMPPMPQMAAMPQIPQMGLQMDCNGNVKDEQKLLLQMDPQMAQQMNGMDGVNPLMIAPMNGMNPVLKSEQLAMGQMGQFDPNFPYFYQNQMNGMPLPNPTLAGN